MMHIKNIVNEFVSVQKIIDMMLISSSKVKNGKLYFISEWQGHKRNTGVPIYFFKIK